MRGIASRAARAVAAVAAIAVLAAPVTGCTQRDKVSWNVSQEADNFNVTRRITVYNVRSDRAILQMTGCMSIQTDTDTDELNVICELPDGTYQKHFIYLNEWTTYVVEDLGSSDVDKYAYELNFMPESIPGVKITGRD